MELSKEQQTELEQICKIVIDEAETPTSWGDSNPYINIWPLIYFLEETISDLKIT